jgi:UDP-N-acetylglucosamine 1-carboxyvinyltransferase
MPKFIIQGGGKLKGEIRVKGAKNAALKIVPAAVLSKEKIKISNLPRIEDIDKSLALFASLGGTYELKGDEAELDPSEIKNTEIPTEIGNKFRASILFVGPLLARFGEVKFSHPGGCAIGGGGKRPIDIFLDGFQALGAEISENNDQFHLKGDLKGGNFFFPLMSVTGT